MTSDNRQPPPCWRIGERYEIGERVGAGAYGVVYRATDKVVGREVAIKLFDVDADPGVTRAWREAAVLRRLNLPGVVRLLDEGREDGWPYLVMPLVEGEHFPGPAEHWETNRNAIIISLIELLNAVHAAGIIHGDLKPQNVLVDANGRVTLLDFGTGSWVSGLSSEHELSRAHGTPAYMAPEQLRGRPATVQSDYYALGVMLYQVLTGEMPHPVDSLAELVRSRLSRRPPSINAEACGLPLKLARAVEGLLAPAAERRVRHLSGLIEALDGDRSVPVSSHQPAFLDPDDVVGRTVAAIDRGESVDIVGERGMGRSRCLEEVSRRLRERGYRVNALIASTQAFHSLSPLVGRGEAGEQVSPQAAQLVHRTHIQEALDGGKILVADNFEKLDPSSRRLLCEERHRGGVICARSEPIDGAMELGPLSAEQLEDLFDGPEPIYRLRSEAARQLWLRTDGVPRAVDRQINLWVRHGLAHFRGEQVVVPPQQLERLRRGLQLQPAGASTDARTEQVHRQLADALPAGAPGRLLHLLRAGEDTEVVAEARAAAEYHDRRGETGLAIAALSEAMGVCKGLDDEDTTYELLAHWAKVALSTEEIPRIEELLYAIERAIDEDDMRMTRLQRLVDAARIACQKADEDVLGTLTALAPFDDWELELRRQMYRMRVALRCSLPAFEEVIDEVGEWIQRDEPGQEALGSFIGWQGGLAYQKGEFGKASELHLQAAEIKERPSAKLASIISAVTALMDGLDYQAALEHAAAALSRAEKLHRHRDQAYCHYLLRSLRYRLGEPLEDARELHQALDMLGSSGLSALIWMVDAADTFRKGDVALAAQYARKAGTIFERGGNRRGAALVGALAIRCEDEADPSEVKRLAAFARECSAPRISIQVLGLLLGASTQARPEWAEILCELASTLPKEQWDKRLEVISVAEAVEAAELA